MTNNKHYDTHVARLDTIIGGDQTRFGRLIQSREEFSSTEENNGHIQWEKYYYWLQDKYGVKLQMSEGGMLNLDYDVIDERKYLIFLMKFDGSVQ